MDKTVLKDVQENEQENKQVEFDGHPIVYMFTAPARSGKDTCGFILKKVYEQMGKKVLWVNYADFLKVVCARNFGYDDTNKEEGRHILQEFGTEIARASSPTIWIDTVFHLFDALRFMYDAFIICDARFENELKPFPYKFTYPIVNIFVDRKNRDTIGEEENKHVSEELANNVNTDKFDYIVDNNNSLEETTSQIANIVLEIEQNKEEFLEWQRHNGDKPLSELENLLNVESKEVS